MKRKNDRIIVFGMIAIGVLAMAGIVTVLGLGAYIYTSEKPTPTPEPAPTVTPAPTPGPVADLKDTLYVRKVLSDGAGRTYTLLIDLRPDADPFDMRRLAVHIVADDKTYNVWDYSHGEHSSTGDDDSVLEPGETFTVTVYLPQADVPMNTGPLMQILLIVDGQTACSLNAPAV
ncbi:MAG: hypothetical protein A4E28_02973 [Methanocella sp. PtaU1.Bin125]|nr:MAG: hypothetical protein A4E28_02973 [Methanocella sp. PtaU1.Bin125]